MCQSVDENETANLLRDGLSTDTQDFDELVNEMTTNQSREAVMARRNSNLKLNRALLESWEYYDSCANRQRNSGLFVADQILNKNKRGFSSAIFTRQSPNGERYGYECPEERDCK